MTNELLWSKIADFGIDDPESSYPFSYRLSSENGWDYGFTLRCIHEYLRFIYLAAVSDSSICPADAVDQVWHLHLLYTQSYWEDMYEGVLGKKIHHGPTRGGKTESEKFHKLYIHTLDVYKNEFKEDAPNDIWLSTNEQFSRKHFVRIDITKNFILPKPKVLWKK